MKPPDHNEVRLLREKLMPNAQLTPDHIKTIARVLEETIKYLHEIDKRLAYIELKS